MSAEPEAGAAERGGKPKEKEGKGLPPQPTPQTGGGTNVTATAEHDKGATGDAKTSGKRPYR